MNVFAWILFGLVAGGIAKWIMPGKDVGGCLTTSFLGIVGGVLGGFIGRHWLGLGPVDGFNLQSLGLAVLGSFLLLLVFRTVMYLIIRRNQSRAAPR